MLRFKSVILVRHSEAEKTIRQVHGGMGTPLTARGRIDTQKLAEQLEKAGLVDPATIIFSSPRPQAVETAQILAAQLARVCKVEDRFRNINMGVFDGLTDEEARLADPAAMKRLVDWRSGRLSIGELKIPDSESITEFVARINNALTDIQEVCQTPVVIMTRSVGIAIVNVLQGYLDGKIPDYPRRRFDPGSITQIISGSSGMTVIIDNDTAYLGPQRIFRDD